MFDDLIEKNGFFYTCTKCGSLTWIAELEDILCRGCNFVLTFSKVKIEDIHLYK